MGRALMIFSIFVMIVGSGARLAEAEAIDPDAERKADLDYGLQNSDQRKHSRQLRARFGAVGQRSEHFLDAACHAAVPGHAG